MSEYRTISVNSALSDRTLSVTAVINEFTAEASLAEREVNADAELSNNIVAVTAQIPESIQADAQLVTRLRHGDYDDYSGAYEVTPMADTEQVLATRNKHMTDDVTVHKVPYYETTNDHGTTVYIAEA